MSFVSVIDIALFAFLGLTAFAILKLRALFAVVMLSAVFSLVGFPGSRASLLEDVLRLDPGTQVVTETSTDVLLELRATISEQRLERIRVASARTLQKSVLAVSCFHDAAHLTL